MYNGLLHLHNFMRWVILLFLLIALFRHLSGMTGKKPFTNADRKTDLFLMISAHITLLIGIYQWFAGDWGYKKIASLGMKGVMEDPAARFFAVEHLAGMLIAIILITIGRGVYRKNITDVEKHRKSFWLFFVALILILASVPWPFREAIARPLFPGM
ncbi:MAG TPA: hypothetical protein VM012_13180 [Flavitalea sp.]|nr:hypothetical protein [Flavitalea sp.]